MELKVETPTPARLPANPLTLMLMLAGIMFGLPAHAVGTIFTVGAGQSCTHETVQDALDAARANDDGGDGDVINVARDLAYTGQALLIDNHSVEIIGGFDACDDAAPNGRTSLGGGGPPADAVIRIRGSGIFTLTNLNISQGDNAGRFGGGIDFFASGTLFLANVGVVGNNAGAGAGISFRRPGGSAVLEFRGDVQVFGNNATSDGGGLYLGEGVLALLVAPDIFVSANTTAAHGGGIAIAHGAEARIASRPVAGFAGISGNSAGKGGGIALLGATSSTPTPRLVVYTTDATGPTSISNNTATLQGGGIYTRGAGTGPVSGGATCSSPVVNLAGFTLEGNSAADGAAIYADTDEAHCDGSATISIAASAAAMGAVHCLSRPTCNEIRGNVATTATGSVIHLDTATRIDASHVTLAGNVGDYLIRAAQSVVPTASTAPTLKDCRVTSNQLGTAVTRFEGDSSEFTMVRCTVADNVFSGMRVFIHEDGASAFALSQSIVAFDTAKGLLSIPGGAMGKPNVSTKQNLVSAMLDARSDGDVTTIAGAARFVDPPNDDYRLRAGSRAVDFGSTVSAPLTLGDLDGRPRDKDLAIKMNANGPRDVGAYERQQLGNLALNGNFDRDLRIWSPPPEFGQYVTRSPSDADNDGNSGSLEVNVPADATGNGLHGAFPRRKVFVQSIEARKQCIHLPGPGNYFLNARAFTGTAFAFTHDIPKVKWRLRKLSTETCDASVDMEGELQFSTSNGWRATLNGPAEIAVAPTFWTPGTTLEVILYAERNPSDPTTSTLFARFDAVTLFAEDDGANVIPVGGEDRIDVPTGGTTTRLASGSFSLLDNDFDGDGDPLSVGFLARNPTSGSVTLQVDGTFAYTHDGGTSLTDEFEYHVCDPDECGTGVVRINIRGSLLSDGFEESVD